MPDQAYLALRALVDALVSPGVSPEEIPALYRGVPGAGDIVPALVSARRALADMEGRPC